METVHLLTAVHTNLAQLLGQTADSVHALRVALHPADWTVRWHVAIDGPNPPAMHLPDADTIIRVGRQVGVSAARNLALSATDGDGWMFALDGDDEIDAHGWADLTDDPAFGSTQWHPTNLLTTGGARTRHWFDTPRHWACNEVEETWTSPLAFHPGNVIARTDLALAVNGWPALQTNEDLAWCFALNNLEPGLGLPHVTLRYRQWAQQTTADPSYTTGKAFAFAFTAATVNARRHRAGLPPIVAPTPSPATLYA